MMHDGHRERMRRKLAQNGSEAFLPHEILEMLLYASRSRGDTNPLAHRLLDRFGSFAGVMDAAYEDLVQVDGVGDSTALLLKLVASSARLYGESKFREGMIMDVDTACEFLQAKYIDKVEEIPSLLLLDNRSRMLRWEMLGQGSINAVEINVRRAVELSVRHQATRVILCHNHPSGIALPSASDILVTENLAEALRMVGVLLIDHIIVAGQDSVSLCQTPEYACLFPSE